MKSKVSGQIIRNALCCPDGTILESFHRWDLQDHIDTITGDHYYCDGGKDYIRTSTNIIPFTSLVVTTDDPFELQREAFTWGSYGKNGDEPKHYIKLKDMTDEHILAILKTQKHIDATYVQELFMQEMDYREGK